MLQIPARWRSLEQEFESELDLIVQSILSDAVSTNGWMIDEEHNILPHSSQETEQRKTMAKNILNARVMEQFQDEVLIRRFSQDFERYEPRLHSTTEFPSNVDEICNLFENIRVEPVFSDEDKKIYRYLRHSWRVPFNTTPGRTLSFIVSSGSEKKVIGIFSLASPAMWMASRDEFFGYEKIDRLEFKNTESIKVRETKSQWIERWKKRGLSNNTKSNHPLSGKFTLFEFFEGMRDTLLQRIQQFPVIVFDDRPDLIDKSLEHGIKLELLTPTRWITGKEPSSTEAHHKLKEKRRRITGKCLEALDVLKAWEGEGFSDTVAHFYDSIHDSAGGGTRISSLKYAMREAKTKRISGDIAELAICGAIPPLNSLRVGKLVAMLSLSKETRSIWNEKYSESDSDIASNLAGRTVNKKANLSSISTTGLYGASNAQYSRIRIPLEKGHFLRWNMVGLTGSSGKGPSNLMLSKHSWNLINSYVVSEGIDGVSGKFGEGTSARIRRMKAAFSRLDQQSSELEYTVPGELNKLLNRLVENPFSRSVHVANLAPNSVRYNLNIDKELTNVDSPSIETIVSYWKQRWLIPYLKRSPEFLEKSVQHIRQITLENLMPPFKGGIND